MFLCLCSVAQLCLFVTPWIVACQAPLSMGFPRQEYWSGLSFPSSGDLLHPGIEPMSPASLTLAGRFFTAAPAVGANYRRQNTKRTNKKNPTQLSLNKNRGLGAKIGYYACTLHTAPPNRWADHPRHRSGLTPWKHPYPQLI